MSIIEWLRDAPQREQQYEIESARADERPAEVKGKAYTWTDVCPSCGEEFIINREFECGPSGFYLHEECPHCGTEVRYPMDWSYSVYLGRREVMRHAD